MTVNGCGGVAGEQVSRQQDWIAQVYPRFQNVGLM